MRALGTIMALVAVAGAVFAGEAAPTPGALGRLLGPEVEVSDALSGRALDTFLAAEHLYRGGRYAEALELLDALWDAAPPGGDSWAEALRSGRRLATSPGLNIGSPPCYYSLRMLTDCARWRVASGIETAAADAEKRATLGVVLAGLSKGVQPRTLQELQEDGGVEVENRLIPALRTDDYAIIRQSLWLFQEYMFASTGGALGSRVRFIDLPELAVRVRCSASPHRYAGMDEGVATVIRDRVPEEVRSAVDWWWFIYPSHVPEQHPDFTRTEFITGGMGGGPDGGSPCFIIDDRWLTRKPPHIGLGPYSEIERRVYLPQWLQHEFMHHLFRIYPEFGLEAKGHQWFDRSTWPEDFEGRFEADYYHEAMHKRLKTADAKPPMQVALRYVPPGPELFRGIAAESLVGRYRHHPVMNDWHIGEITVDERDAEGRIRTLRWTNKAGASWRLTPRIEGGQLAVGEDCPYYASGSRAFYIVLKRDADGEYLPAAAGFRFQQGTYLPEP